MAFSAKYSSLLLLLVALIGLRPFLVTQARRVAEARPASHSISKVQVADTHVRVHCKKRIRHAGISKLDFSTPVIAYRPSFAEERAIALFTPPAHIEDQRLYRPPG